MRSTATRPSSWSRPPEAIRRLFDEISGGYDLFNSLFSGTLDRRWRRQAVLVLSPNHSGRYLDLCTGTGKLAREILCQARGDATVIGLDFAPRMLNQARCGNGARPLFPAATGEDKRGLAPFWVQGQAETLPFPNHSFDGVTLGFSLRNVANLDQVLREIHRVLRPHGVASFLETTQPSRWWVRWWRAAHLTCVMPLVGWATTGRWDAFQYFRRSVQGFEPPERVMERMRQAGFSTVHYIPLTMELVAIYKGVK